VGPGAYSPENSKNVVQKTIPCNTLMVISSKYHSFCDRKKQSKQRIKILRILCIMAMRFYMNLRD
jgi:hypothetical protein